MSNLDLWDKVKTVPQEAQKPIKAGRLNGMTDISPIWRFHEITNQFGPCGIGWKYTVEKQWIENGSGGIQCANTNINLCFKHDGEWSEPIPGTGGSMFVAKESKGLYTSDEAYKMSLTDALSVAMKALGFGAVIYSGGNDYSKYTSPQQNQSEQQPQKEQPKTFDQNKANFLKIKKQLTGAGSVTELATIMANWERAIDVMPEKGSNELDVLYDRRKAEFEHGS